MAFETDEREGGRRGGVKEMNRKSVCWVSVL